jgi:hypothetical protein
VRHNVAARGAPVPIPRGSSANYKAGYQNYRVRRKAGHARLKSSDAGRRAIEYDKLRKSPGFGGNPITISASATNA